MVLFKLFQFISTGRFAKFKWTKNKACAVIIWATC